MGAGGVALVPFRVSGVSAKLRRKKTADSDEMVSNRRACICECTCARVFSQTCGFVLW